MKYLNKASRMSRLENELMELKSALSTLPESSDPPSNFLEILELDTDEKSWQKVLRYFLDPDEPHGFDSIVLQKFLNTLKEKPDLGFDYDRADLVECEIDEEVQSKEEKNRADLVIRSGWKWFVWLELKVWDEEGANQTEKYADDDYVGDVPKDEFSQEGSYIYISSSSRPGPESEDFVDLEWTKVADTLREGVEDAAREVPGSSQAQLNDFINRIQEEMGMTRHQQNLQDKKELYFKYKDAIEDAQEGIEEFVRQEIKQKWDSKLKGQFTPESWSEEWSCDAVGHGYGQLRWNRWDELDGFDIHFEHNPGVQHFIEGELLFNLDFEGDRDRRERFKEEMRRRFPIEEDGSIIVFETPDGEKLRSAFDPGRRGSDYPSQRIVFRTTYQYTPGSARDYFEKLSDGFDDHYPVAQDTLEIIKDI